MSTCQSRRSAHLGRISLISCTSFCEMEGKSVSVARIKSGMVYVSSSGKTLREIGMVSTSVEGGGEEGRTDHDDVLFLR